MILQITETQLVFAKSLTKLVHQIDRLYPYLTIVNLFNQIVLDRKTAYVDIYIGSWAFIITMTSLSVSGRVQPVIY